MNAKEYLLDCKAKLVAEQTRQINLKVQEKAGEIATRQAEAERLRVEKVKELDIELNDKVHPPSLAIFSTARNISFLRFWISFVYAIIIPPIHKRGAYFT